MEVVASLLGVLVTEPARILCGSIYSKVSDAFKFQSNFNALEQKMKSLIDRRNKIKEQLDTAEKEGKLPIDQVEKWLTEVEVIEQEVEVIEQEVNSMQANTNTVLCGCSLNCSWRCRLGTTVAEKLEEVNRLNDSSFPAGMVEANRRVKSVEHIPGPSIQTQTTASANLDKIMNLLNEDAVRRIGVWGMGGVGKTTLVKNLNNNLQSGSLKQLFDIVIWVTVSKDCNLERVQTQIAKRLGLTLKSEERQDRAIVLYQRLEKEKKFLLILDDVWDTFDLDSLGVPQPENHRGSNIILTSRFLEVCKGMRTDAEVKVDVLNSEEAWQLFVTNAGSEATLEQIEPLAKAVAKECSRLPLALVTVGRAMAGKTMKEQWKDALKELQRSEPDIIRGIEKEVYKPLRWSYDSLQGKNIKPCFLYCSLFPEDCAIEVNELVQCWKAEGLIGEQTKHEDSLNRGITIIQNLKDSCLLEKGDNENTVKMHDVVRDVAIWIASSMEDGCKFVVRSGMRLSQISDVELLKKSKRISFMDNKITTLPDCVIQCPKTSTLLLQDNYPLERVPQQFLQGFQVLRVLNMSGTRIQSLPLSLTQLSELRALVLWGCDKLEELPSLGGLIKLQVLDLGATGIKELPKGMEELSNLSQLNLSGTKQLKTILAGVVSKLSSLEVLDVRGSSYTWGVIEDVEEGQATFEELGCMTRLIVVDIHLGSVPYQDLHWIQRLRSFHISLGRYIYMSPSTNLDERMVTLGNLNLIEKRIGWLLINATHLNLASCKEIGWMFEYLVTNTRVLAGLKILTILLCDGLMPMGGCAAPHDLLPNLEKLVLENCSELEDLRPLVALLGLTFSRLKFIQAVACPKLKYLIPVELIPNLMNLEEIKISHCAKLENLFDYGNCSSGQMVATDPVLPKLRELQLKRLPKLRNICRENESWQSLEQLKVFHCNELKRLPLTTQNAETIKRIKGEQQWWSKLVWDDDDTKLSLQPYFKRFRNVH